MSSVETRETPSQIKVLVVIAHYNHFNTLRQVATQCRAVWPYVLVVDDGSDNFSDKLLENIDVHLVRQMPNQGKGAAILAAATWAKQHHFTHIITIDSDGQHRPEDIARFVSAAKQQPSALIIGVRKFDDTVPRSSRFGRAFGNFWVHLQTGKAVRDIQSGYRCYPVDMLDVLTVWSKRYAFEVEVTVRALWAGFSVKEIEIPVVYTKERISHFHKLKDNFRLTVLNTYLTMRAMLPVAHRQYEYKDGKLTPRPFSQTLRDNLTAPGSVWRNACSAAWGIFCGSIALPGIRQVWLFGGAGWWNLNRLVCISFEKLCVGPIVPALCIEVGYYVRYGHFLTQFNFTTLGRQALQRVWEWVLGSLVVAPILGAITFVVVAVVCWVLRRSFYEHA